MRCDPMRDLVDDDALHVSLFGTTISLMDPIEFSVITQLNPKANQTPSLVSKYI